MVKGDDEEVKLINELYRNNEGRKNSLTGKSGNALNSMLYAFNPLKYVSVVSLNDRKKIIKYFGFGDGPDFDKDSSGSKIMFSNKSIINGFKSLGINVKPRTMSIFLYSSIMRNYWKLGEVEEVVVEEPKPSWKIKFNNLRTWNFFIWKAIWKIFLLKIGIKRN